MSSRLEKGNSEIDSTGAIEAALAEDKGKVRRSNKKESVIFLVRKEKVKSLAMRIKNVKEVC